MALALPTSTLYTGIDSTVTYSRLRSTIETVNGGGVVVLYLHRANKVVVERGRPPLRRGRVVRDVSPRVQRAADADRRRI